MNEEKDYFEIRKDAPLQKDQVEYIEKNPEGLTKEGCEQRIKEWKASNNRYVKKMYERMLETCRTFETSGKTNDGKTILARKNGKITSMEI